MGELVKFFTGSPYLPHRVVVSFSSSDVLPVAHACYCELQLPTTHSGYDQFRDNMIHGMMQQVYALDAEN